MILRAQRENIQQWKPSDDIVCQIVNAISSRMHVKGGLASHDCERKQHELTWNVSE